MKITKRRLKRIIREALILEAETADTSDAEDVARAVADEYGFQDQEGQTNGIIINISQRTVDKLGDEIKAAVEENGWKILKSLIPNGGVLVHTGESAAWDAEIKKRDAAAKPAKKKSRLRSMLGL